MSTLGVTPLAARLAASAGRRDTAAPEVDPEVEQDYLRRLASQSGQALESLGLVLDTPGALARGVLAGDPLSGFAFDSDRRVTGTELLDSYGFKPSDDSLYGWGPGLAGFAAEVALDPLLLFSFGTSAMPKAARAAQAAGVLKYAPRAAMAKMGPGVGNVIQQASQLRTGKAVLDDLTRAGVPLTKSTLDVRPIIGERLSRYRSTLADAVAMAPQRQRPEIMRQLKDFYGSDTAVQNAMGDRLGDLFGFGVPGITDTYTFSPFGNRGNEAVMDAFDYLANAAKWNPVTRYGASFVQKAVGGRSDTAGQIDALKFNARVNEAAKARGELLATKHGQLLRDVKLSPQAQRLLGADTLFSTQGNDLAARFSNGKPTANDLAVLAAAPELQDFISNWRTYAPASLFRQKSRGLRVGKYTDPFGNLYSPQIPKEFDFGALAQGGSGRVDQAATFESMYTRNQDLATPGGVIDLREISMLPIVREHAMAKGGSRLMDEEVGEEIADYIATKFGNPMITDKQGTAIARVMRTMNKNLPADVPAFSEHPINAQMRYMVDAEMRVATGDHIMDSIAEYAQPGKFTQQTGVTMRSVQETLGKHSGALGFEVGKFSKPTKNVAAQLKARLAARSGVPANKIKLSQWHIPQEAADRLVRIKDFYQAPAAQQEVGNMFSAFQNLMKGALLVWPSRYTRDQYSNLASIWLETGDAPGAVAGMWAASKILAGKQDAAVGFLRKIPRYERHFTPNGVNTAALLREMEQDVGGNGVLSGLATSDLLTSNRTGDINQFIPGATPTTISGGLKELIPTTANPITQASDFFSFKGINNTFETRNAVLNAGQKIGDAVDSIARLGGFLTLLKNGIGPQEAATRVKSALVDYSSLTTFERNWLKNIFLWWSYQSRIGKYAVKSLYENPGGRYAQMIRAVNDLQRPTDDTGYIPTALRQQVAVRLPDFLQQNPGTTTYLKNIDLPGLDVLNILQPAPTGQTFPVNVQKTFMELVNQSNPLAKSIGELAFDTDLYSKRPLAEARTSLDKVVQGLTGDPTGVNPVVKAIVQNIPGTSRPLSLLGTALDPNVENPYYRTAKILVNELSGLKLQDVDPEYQLLDARNKIGEALKQYQNTSTVRSIPKDRLPFVPPDAQRMNAVDKQLQKRLAEFYERKRRQRAMEELRRLQQEAVQ
jgi:hypothetical protein